MLSRACCVASLARSTSRRIRCATARSPLPTPTAKSAKASSSPCCARDTRLGSIPTPRVEPDLTCSHKGMGATAARTVQSFRQPGGTLARNAGGFRALLRHVLRYEDELMDPHNAETVDRRRGRFVGLIALLAAAGGLFAVVLAGTLTTPPSPAGEVAGVTFAPDGSDSLASHEMIQPSPTPTPTPTPVTFTPYTGRLSGTWLLRQHLSEDARHAGVYPRDLILIIQPECDVGPCSVTARLVDPRTDKTLSTKPVGLTAGYPFSIGEEHRDLCAGDDGRTVEDGAARSTSFEIQALLRSDTAETILSVDGAGRLEPNKRGRSVGCREIAHEFEVTAEN